MAIHAVCPREPVAIDIESLVPGKCRLSDGIWSARPGETVYAAGKPNAAIGFSVEPSALTMFRIGLLMPAVDCQSAETSRLSVEPTACLPGQIRDRAFDSRHCAIGAAAGTNHQSDVSTFGSD